MLSEYYADLHIHIGQAADGQPVKITASPALDFASIAIEALERKGIQIAGIIDCASPAVIADIEKLLEKGEMEQLSQGGIIYRDELLIIPGAEVESREKNGKQAHYLAYFPFLEQLKEYSQIMAQYISNIQLSSQAASLSGNDIFQIVDTLGGIFVPAHAFTPHKSFYGSCFESYRQVFTEEQWQNIPAIELGLSADTSLATRFSELEGKVFLSNSDAHSLANIGREYNILQMGELNFSEFSRALFGREERAVIKNYGLDPRLGKYHRSFCKNCQESFPEKGPVLKCPLCGSENKLVTGVKDRVLAISDRKDSDLEKRPSYIYQIPLKDIPGIGPVTLDKLLDKFATEMDIIHQTDLSQLKEVIPERLARKIIRARQGKAKIRSGGGGNYGKVI